MPITSAKELRAAQAKKGPLEEPKSDKEKADAFSARFKKACDGYYDALMKVIEERLEKASESTKTYIIFTDPSLIEKYEGLAHTTMLYGFWDKETNDFDNSIFVEQKVKSPMKRVEEAMEKLGYTVEDISDSSRSKKPFFKVSW